MIVIADAGKRVKTLGAFPLPVEIDRFGAQGDAAACRGGGARTWAGKAKSRSRDKAGAPFITDGGHLILDCAFGAIPEPATAGLAA